MIRLLLVAEQPSLRKGLTMRLAVEHDLAVIGEAVDCETALALAKSQRPEVVLIDADMIAEDGISIANRIHVLYPKISIVILSIRDDIYTCNRAETAGAAAFVVKSLPADTLLVTIRGVAGRVF